MPAKSKKFKKRILNCKPSQDTQKDWKIEHARAAGLVSAPGVLPPKVDLRESWWDVGDQEDTGSCVGWAAADGVLRYQFVKAGKLGKDDHLSARYLWMAAKETDELTNYPTTFIDLDGTSLKAALDIARKFGAVTDDILPLSGALYKDNEQTFYAIAAQRKISSYFSLGLTVADWRLWLATVGPILTRFDMDPAFDNAKTNPNLDTYTPYDSSSDRAGGHAVTIVGYTPDRFIIRNSWGTNTWGDKGFAYASYAYAMAAYTEAYGVKL